MAASLVVFVARRTKYPTIQRVTRCVRRHGIFPVGRPSDASCFPVRSHGGPSLSACTLVLALRGLWCCHCFRCWSSHVEDAGVERRLLTIKFSGTRWSPFMNRSWKYCFATCHVKLVERGTFWLLRKGSEGSTAFFVLFVPITILEARGLSLRGVGLPQSFLVKVEARFGAAPSGSTSHGAWSS